MVGASSHKTQWFHLTSSRAKVCKVPKPESKGLQQPFYIKSLPPQNASPAKKEGDRPCPKDPLARKNSDLIGFVPWKRGYLGHQFLSKSLYIENGGAENGGLNGGGGRLRQASLDKAGGYIPPPCRKKNRSAHLVFGGQTDQLKWNCHPWCEKKIEFKKCNYKKKRGI